MHHRFGKISKEGKLLERNINYRYCSHSMGPEGKCFFYEKKETLSLIEIKSQNDLKKIKKSEHWDEDSFKPLVPEKVSSDLLIPIKFNPSYGNEEEF